MVEECRSRERGCSLVVRLERIDGEPVRTGALLGSAQRLYPGQRLWASARLTRLTGPDNPGEYDAAGAALRNGIAWRGRIERLDWASDPGDWRVALEGLRARLAEHTRRIAPSPQSAALFLTLSAGLRASLPDEMERDFAASGLAHVLSVSGLHVAALALLVLWALRLLLSRLPGVRGDPRRPAALASIPLVWAYVLFTGWQPPAVRSAVMATLVLAGLGLPRPADALNGLSLAALGLIALRPASVAELSLQLSFCAVLALLVLSPALRASLGVARPPPTGDDLRYWTLRAREAALQTLSASLAVTLATAPLAAHGFGRVSLAGLLSNVLALPLSAALTGVAASAAAVFALSPALATPLLWTGDWMSEGLGALAAGFGDTPLSVVDVPRFPVALAVGYLGALAVFALAPRWRWRSASAAAAALAVHLLGSPGPGRPGELVVTFLAVGHGDAIVISSGGRHALVDGGGVPHGADVGARIVLPFLRERRIRALDLAVLSHPHPDHALGLISTLRELPVRRLWYAAGTEGGLTSNLIAAAEGAQVEAVEHRSASAQLGEATLDVLGPPADRELLEGVNDRSVVLLLRHGEVTFLLSGDLEEAGEADLEAPAVTVLKVPHHGSRTSSGGRLVAATRPRYAVFCVGRANRYGLPHPEVVERWEQGGARCVRTDRDGAITFVSDGADVRLETWHPSERPAIARSPVPPHLGLE